MRTLDLFPGDWRINPDGLPILDGENPPIVCVFALGLEAADKAEVRHGLPHLRENDVHSAHGFIEFLRTVPADAREVIIEFKLDVVSVQMLPLRVIIAISPEQLFNLGEFRAGELARKLQFAFKFGRVSYFTSLSGTCFASRIINALAQIERGIPARCAAACSVFLSFGETQTWITFVFVITMTYL
jgi:hypothetical protein